jgi:hypothetical protein
MKITIALEGSTAELSQALRSMADGLDLDGQEVLDEDEDNASDDTGTVVASTGWWTPKRGNKLIREMTDNAVAALAVICKQAPEVSFEDVQEAVGLDGVTLGGAMSSMGAAIRRLNAPAPVLRDYNRRVYLVDRNTARVLLEAIERDQQS